MDTMFNGMNLSMMADFYEFTMANGFFELGMKDKIAYFDLFYRKVPDGGGFAIAAGLEQAVKYLQNLHFSPADIDCLASKNLFSQGFLSYLENFEFCCDVWAVPEGTPIFPGEPLVVVRGPSVQAQIIETMLLSTINHQSLIATKASRVARAATGRTVMEFGARRAHSYSGAVYGSRAAYIGGCPVTSNTLADRMFGIPATGTMAHSWIQMFETEYEAFAAYAKIYPADCTLLLDTYDVLNSGLPNAIKVFSELAAKGYRPSGVRIDSGDIAYLSRMVRKRLDEAGFEDCKIIVSNALDEYVIREMLIQGAQIDIFGVGERLITSRSEPVFGGVYKLCAVEDDEGNIIPKIKLSENVSKITIPHFKKLWRFFERDSGKAIADVLSLHDEVIDDTVPFKLFHPEYTWKTKIVSDFKAEQLLVPIFKGGELVYDLPALEDIKTYCQSCVDYLWDEVKRFENPHEYYVDLTYPLWEVKQKHLSRGAK